MECVEERALYNINYNLARITPGTKPEWRCVYHLPKETTFVVGCMGEEELKKAGRWKPKSSS